MSEPKTIRSYDIVRYPEIDAIEAARTALVQSDENYQLRGEIRVLVGLLEAVLPIIKTVDGEDADECNQLMDLQNKPNIWLLGLWERILTLIQQPIHTRFIYLLQAQQKEAR